ncbi:MAG: SDR family oxidoreductase [Thermomicrobiales bacterium]
MDLGLKGKIAIVAASSKGLGRATATILAREGALVTVNGRDPGSLKVTADEIRAETGGDVIEIAGDMREPADIERLIAETVAQRGGLDILVCNAGGPPYGNFSKFPDDQAWLDAINLNLMSTLRLSRAAIPHLLERGGGSITNIMSVSVKQPIPNLVLSNTARTGVMGLAKSLALEFADRNIRVNTVLPGTHKTDRVLGPAKQRAESSGQSLESILKEDAAVIPMGRMGEPEEFGRVVAFIASPAASYVTGVAIAVDGGSTRSTL